MNAFRETDTLATTRFRSNIRPPTTMTLSKTKRLLRGIAAGVFMLVGLCLSPLILLGLISGKPVAMMVSLAIAAGLGYSVMRLLREPADGEAGEFLLADSFFDPPSPGVSVNPSTGLPTVHGIDTAGNPSGVGRFSDYTPGN